jgi:hypothetical protein
VTDEIPQTGEVLQAAPADPAKVWPQEPPAHTHVYGFIDPAWNVQMVAMTVDTWQDIIRDVKIMKARLDQLSAENIEFRQGRNPAGEGGRILTLDKLRNN